MKYIDGYVVPVLKKNLPVYRRMAQKAGKIWREYGAMEFRECVGDDLKTKMALSFPSTIKSSPARPWFFHGSSSNRARIVTSSTRR